MMAAVKGPAPAAAMEIASAQRKSKALSLRLKR